MNVMGPIDPPPGPIGFSTADFWRLMDGSVFEDLWVELIHGRLEEMPPPGRMHGRWQMAVIAVPLSFLRAALADLRSPRTPPQAIGRESDAG